MTTWVSILLMANVGMYFVQQTAPVALINSLVFVPPLILVQPWAIVTYMFLHGDLMHLLFNMLGLFFFGSQVEDRLGSRKFLQLYFVAGVTGALLSFALAPRSPIIGASAGVFGIMLAFAYYWPDAPIMIWGIIPVPARILVIVTTVLALWSGVGGSRGGVADFAHLGGYVGAYLYLKWMGRTQVAFKKKAEGGGRTLTAQWGKKEKRPVVDLTSVHALNRDEVNRILDKISESGMGSLTPQEKQFLSNFVPPDDREQPGGVQ